MNLVAKYFAEWEDRKLVQRFLQHRGEIVFRELYHRHSARLYQLALRLTGGEAHAAEEILQETWMRALKGLAGFRWQSRLHTWLSAIVINCAREFLRARTVQRAAQPPAETDLIAPATDEARRLDLEQAIAALPAGYRHVLVLYDIEGYHHEEISRLLDIEIGTSKSQLFHARRALRHALGVA